MEEIAEYFKIFPCYSCGSHWLNKAHGREPATCGKCGIVRHEFDSRTYNAPLQTEPTKNGLGQKVLDAGGDYWIGHELGWKFYDIQARKIEEEKRAKQA